MSHTGLIVVHIARPGMVTMWPSMGLMDYSIYSSSTSVVGVLVLT